MREPTPLRSRLVIVGALAGLAAAGGAGFWAGRSGAPAAAPIAAPAPAVTTRPVATPSAALARALGRFELTTLANEAADALSAGEAPSAALAGSVGQQVDVVLPFGCAGPIAGTTDPAADAPTGWRYDAQAQALRVRVRPVRWQPADWGLPPGSATVTGFWLSRPWSSADRCPDAGAAIPGDAGPVTLPGETVALGFFGPGDARVPERERAFETVQRSDQAAGPGAAGLRMRVLGRLGAVADGGPVRCVQPAGIEQRPVCIVAIRPETLRIEDAGDGSVLGEWALAAD